MQVWYGPEQVPASLSSPNGHGSVVTIGIFDGVHRGHQAILQRVVARAQGGSTQNLQAQDVQAGAARTHAAQVQGTATALPEAAASLPATNAPAAAIDRPLAVAITFDPHPATVHRPENSVPLIASLTDRLDSLEAAGLDAVLIVHYTLDFAAQSPEDFIRTWVEGLLGARAVVVGDDVRFGTDNSGDAQRLQQIGQADGLEVEIVADVLAPNGRRWSSTWVRELLQAGEVAGAAEVLGRPHRLRGTVVHGLRRGRELGFPTANLEAASAGVVPPDGIYAGWLLRSLPASRTEPLPAAISIGTNPTFDDVPSRTVEAHVLGRSDLNLYGQEVAIELVEKLRPMLAFAGLEPLLVQMREDVVRTAQILGVPVPEPIDPAAVTA
ncbi:Riboflavin biosynthesis protein ribF [Actinomyces bovis]|uniref:Riboflavin biosynthesis protein ribF n=1 Tax=Actinomyces bovis TaxID=1658 RepID=A0ABY1VKJ6_9ACTO|nr:bifunctional riboflavin kinase/FAD synthetase [Actinomyces bovis]SPT52619.1 Riboflavin biosynthesis protein ribF [Actinomyces bovis]VEG54478.1 Riboflavin biosynthesis protein ribF [Actinomyces israelii]